MTELQQINEELDTKLISFFETLSSLYQEQKKLNDQIKDGFWNMSRARYNMGIKFVGIDQIHEDDMCALTKVKVREDETEMFEGYSSLHAPEETQPVETVGLRKRNVGQSQEVSTPVGDDTASKTKKQHDPIRWFGVLVPPSLRQCQNQFKSSVETTIAIANLKQKLLGLKSEYLDLQKRKAEVASNISK